MKRRILTLWIMVTAIANNVVAQEKNYLVTEGKQWAICSTGVCPPPNSTTITYRLQGDTIIDSKRYLVEYESYDIHLTDWKPSGRYMREENGKVYSKYEKQEETVLLDYGIQVGDTLRYKDRTDGIGDTSYVYACLVNVRDTILPNGDGVSRRCYDVSVGEYINGTYHPAEHKTSFIEDIGWLDTGLCDQYFFADGGWQELLCVKQGDNILYQKEKGISWKGDNINSRPITRRGYGLYYGDTYLYKYTINEAEEVKDSTDFAVWNDRSVIYFDVDTVGTHAFTNATFRQGQILYFSDKLNCIMPDAFTDILMADNKSDEKNPFGDLCIVFSGDNAPCIEKSSISNYADTTYRITYVVPDLATYIASDIQWTYSQLVTIDDFIKGYVSPENEISVADSTEIEVEVEEEDMGFNGDGDYVDLTVSARPRKDIPIRIGDGENKDIYSRAPAWMRYTVELEITDTEGKVLYTDAQQCSAYDECEFVISFARPENNIIYVYSRSIDQFDRATEWAVEAIDLANNTEGDYVTDANVHLDKVGETEELTATIGTDSIRITGYFLSNCGGGLYCVANTKENNIELLFHDGVSANCVEYHYVDFTIPRMVEQVDRIYVINGYDQNIRLEVKIIDNSVNNIIPTTDDAPYYDLQGREVAHPTRGIYIRNGRKVIVQ